MISHFWDYFISNFAFFILFNRRLPLENDDKPTSERELSSATAE